MLNLLEKQAAEVVAVSFDIFDTLFTRPLSDPEDLFEMIGEKFGIPDFRRIRQDAQAQAFRRMHEQNRNEITLDGIYDCMPGLPIDPDVLKKAEYDLELTLTIPNPELRDLFLDLVGRKPVVVTSDMYLPKQFFEDLFRRYGLPLVPMFISSDRDATKRDRGELFDLMSREVGVPLELILHIGDNPFSDIQQARAKNLKTFHYQASRGSVIRRALPPSASIAASVARVHEAAIPQRSFYEFGFLYGGPAAAGFLHWVQDEALRDSVDFILFVSRDGYVLERMARRGDVGPLPQFSYFKGSRTAFTMAAMNENNFAEHIDFLAAASEDLSPCEVLERVGVPAPAPNVMSDLGLADHVRLSRETDELLRRFLYAYKWEILKVGRRNLQSLFHYLKQLGVRPGMRVALVDIGWNGTTVHAFAGAVGALMDLDILGYYFCLTDQEQCLQRRREVKMKALISSDVVSSDLVARIYSNRVAVELMFSAPHDAVIGYQLSAAGELEFLEDGGRSGRCDLSRVSDQIVRGIEDFGSKFHEICRQADYRPRPLETVLPLVEYVTNIDASALSLFTSIQNFDAWASSRNRDMALTDYLSTASNVLRQGEATPPELARSVSAASNAS